MDFILKNVEFCQSWSNPNNNKRKKTAKEHEENNTFTILINYAAVNYTAIWILKILNKARCSFCTFSVKRDHSRNIHANLQSVCNK